MRIEESFFVKRPPEAVFDFVTDPAKLPEWQTSKTFVEQLSEGAPGAGARFREGTKPAIGKEFTQVTEFTEFDRPRRLHVHVVDGPYPIDGTWSFEREGDGTRVQFVAEGDLGGALRMLEPVTRLVLAREFAAYHRNLRRRLERF